LENPEIYDFNETSPSNEAFTAKPTKEDKPASRSGRRYSSIPRDIAGVSDGEASDIEARKKEVGTTRRRQSTLGLKSASAITDQAPERTVRKTTSTTGLPDSGVGDSRGDRIAARRRSMML